MELKYIRKKYAVDTADGDGALESAKTLLQQGRYLDALDIYEQLVAAYPHAAVPLLVQVYDLYQMLPDSETRYSLYQARHFNFDISPGDRVLDLGSGNLPFPLATELADISTTDHQYGRAGEPFKHVAGKPVYECNIEATPFETNQFDFVYCAHVMEHVENPERACKEVMRIGKRGFIETPNRGKDLFLNTALASNHLWSVEYLNNFLIFTEYDPQALRGLECDILMSMHTDPQTDREKAFSALVLLKSDMVNTMLMWEGGFNVEVRRMNGEAKRFEWQ